MKTESGTPVATARSERSTAPRSSGYREDQGRLARMAAFWACVLLLLFGCTFVHGLLTRIDALDRTIQEIHIPVVGVDVTGAFLIALGLFTVGTYAIHRWQRRPKTADLLIETESELRKVTWPSLQEVVNSSMVVVLCVVLLLAFLAFADWFLARVMRYFLLGEA